MEVLGWRAWYDDRSVYSSADMDWKELPPIGIVGVVVYHEQPYRTVLTAGDWYWMQDGEIHRIKTHSEWGKWADAPDTACQSCVKKSGALSDDGFEAVLDEMMESQQWP